MNESWILSRDGLVDEARNETLFAQGNGYLGIRGHHWDPARRVSPGVFVNGFYEIGEIHYGESAYGFAKHHQTIVNVPEVTALEWTLDGKKPAGPIRSVRSLDFRTGIGTWVESYAIGSGILTLTQDRIVSFAHRHRAAIRTRIELPEGGGTLGVRIRYAEDRPQGDEDWDPRAGRGDAVLRRLEGNPAVRGGSFRYRTPRGGMDLGVGFAFDFDPEPVSGSHDSGDGGEFWDFDFGETREISLIVHSAYGYGPDADGIGAEIEVAKETDFADYTVSQQDFLDRYWAGATVEIGGDEVMEGALRFNAFHIAQSAGRWGDTSIAAKGVTGDGYEGHFFWDTEIYVLPFMTYAAPEIARSLLEYRRSILPQARERARELNQEGALFPWRTIGGEESSAFFPAGTAQYHIDADVAYGIDRFFRARRESVDPGMLEVLVETARMWADLGEYNSRKGGAFCIHEVTGPDEYTAMVDNNAYTNLMAEWNLRAAAEAVEDYRGRDPQGFARWSETLELDSGEAGRWLRAAEAMYLPFEATEGIHPQNEGFLDKPPWDFAATPADKYPLLLHYHPLVIYRYRVIKQADLVLALLLRGDCFSLAEKWRNFRYYEGITTGDSSLSACVQGIIACELGYLGLAAEYFRATFLIDLEDYNNNVHHGVHTASMAGSWLAAVFGAGAFRDFGGDYRFDPRLPPGWDRLVFTLRFGEGSLGVEAVPGSCTLAWSGPGRFECRVGGRQVALGPGERASVGLDPEPKGAVLFGDVPDGWLPGAMDSVLEGAGAVAVLEAPPYEAPDPAWILDLADRTGIRPGDWVVVSVNPSVLRSARRAGACAADPGDLPPFGELWQNHVSRLREGLDYDD